MNLDPLHEKALYLLAAILAATYIGLAFGLRELCKLLL